jgi:hypothetical protein
LPRLFFAAETGPAAGRAILLHRKILGKLTAPKLSTRGGVEVVCHQRVEQTAGDWADTKDGVSIWFPVLAAIIF